MSEATDGVRVRWVLVVPEYAMLYHLEPLPLSSAELAAEDSSRTPTEQSANLKPDSQSHLPVLALKVPYGVVQSFMNVFWKEVTSLIVGSVSVASVALSFWLLVM